MTEKEKVARLKKLYEAEDYFPGFLGNPVAFAVNWGLPYSGYIKELAEKAAGGKKKTTLKRRVRPAKKN
jgi:hypothetical protein